MCNHIPILLFFSILGWSIYILFIWVGEFLFSIWVGVFFRLENFHKNPHFQKAQIINRYSFINEFINSF